MEALVPEVVKQGGLFALAVFAIWGLNKVWEDRHRSDLARIECERQDKLALLEVLAGNTKAITHLSVMVDELKDVVVELSRSIR